MTHTLTSNIFADTALYSLLGIALFMIAMIIINAYFKHSIKHEIIEDQNIAMAVIVASINIGIALIIAAAIFG